MATPNKRSNEEANGTSPASSNKRFKTNYEEIVKVLVGPDKTPFNVHKATICAKSKFFEAALTRDWQEKKEATVNLPDMAPYEFAVFVHWMYTGDIVGEENGFRPPIKDSFSAAFAAFLAGDALEAEALRNEAFNKLIVVRNSVDKLPSSKQRSRHWHKTAENSQLRLFLIDLYASSASGDSLANNVEMSSSEFIQQVLRRLVQFREGHKGVAPTLATACKYHDHKETPKCSQT